MKLRGLTYTNEGEGGRVLDGKKLRLETHWVHDGKGREDSGHQAESDEAGYQRKAKGVRVSEGAGAAAGTGRAARRGPSPPAERSAPPSPPTFSGAGARLRPPAVGSSVQSRVESPVPALVDLCGRKGGCRGSALGRDNCLSGPGPCILGDMGADLVISRFMTPKRAGGG
ncbi:uncharacterized protein LOC126953402 [Macaca thibetana thibetana]|uniref:uncharacterized protein LOC126953402 n=1 Tax=Macaca thibetana thibetana TaxID=257877 RepID=UPI0021BC9140|nr:uncharacterized protein LOC126953402 [Macaca thibetana thibetana]